MLNGNLYSEDIAECCYYGRDFVKELLTLNGCFNIYEKPEILPMSQRKIDGYKKIGQYMQYYQKNPVKFVYDFFNIQLLDSQVWIFTESWNKQQSMILASRAYGKSFFVVLFDMVKQMLSCTPWNCYIASGSSDQSATTFKKLEDIANDRIESLIGSTGGIFKHEVEINNSAGDGFSHSPAGHEYHLYNGSLTKSLNSNYDRQRGKRASCVIFDEGSFLSSELIKIYEAFTAVDKDFKTGISDDGKSFDSVMLHALPREIPNQLLYVSSASTTDTEFYRMYREFSKKMLIGDPNYFVADINCDLVMKPTIRGKGIKSGLTKDKIESALRTSPDKARREYYNEFTTDAGSDAIIKRGVISRNEETRKPVHCNETGDKKYGLFYDPARKVDNSFILVAEFYDFVQVDGSIDRRAKIVNGVNLLDIGKKIKSPMRTPDQVEYLKQLILDYNAGADGYENIVGIWIDAGTGGAGVNIADYLMSDWETADGIVHRGLIDKEYSADYVSRFPNAVNKIHLMEPAKYKSIMYESVIEMVNQDKISFTATYDNKEYLTVFDIDQEKLNRERERIINTLKKKNLNEKEFEEKLQEELEKVQSVNTKTIKLDWKDKIALANIDSLKEEVVNMVRKKRESGKDSFELTPEKANKLHDDRSYTLAMLGHALAEERRKLLLQKPKTNKNDLLSKLTSQIHGGIATRK